jgi:pilus assembly protein CpaE
MKIAVISPSPTHLQEMRRVLESASHTVFSVDGGKSRMRAVAEQEQPDLMLVDGMCCDIAELAQVEHVSTHYPQIAIVLLCSTHSPEFLINSMRAGVREVLPSPASTSALQAAVARVAAKQTVVPLRTVGKILAFLPCKGGTGATFVATNVAYELAERKTVLLIDLNLQFGDALSFVHDAQPASTIADVAKNISRLDASLLSTSAVKITPSLCVLAAPEDPSEALEIKPEHIDEILALATNHYDFIVLDMGRSIDTVAIKALDRAHRIYPVLQAGLPDLRNATKLLKVFKSLGYPSEKIELIVNRFERGGAIAIDQIRRSLDPFKLNTVANSFKDVNASINHGEPLVKSGRSSAVSKNIAEIASALNPRRDESSGLLDRLFRRA